MMAKSNLLVLLSLAALFQPAKLRAQEYADSIFITEALAEARFAGNVNPLFFARKFLGKPYVAYTLEVNEEERLVVNTRQVDCTTLVENVTALVLCASYSLYDYADFKDMLLALRYRHGVLDGYESRLHYFSDWIDDNQTMGFVEEIQVPDPPFTDVQKLDIHYMSSHPNAYKALRTDPSLVDKVSEIEHALTGRTYRFIPKNIVGDTMLMRRAVRDGDIIAITSNKSGLDIAHLGLSVWRQDGLHLLNASQIHKEVVEEPMTLYQYLQKHPSHTGIRVIRINGVGE